MSKYTAGPWLVAKCSPYRVMSANKTVHGGVEFGVYICDTANNKATRTPENAANARLIAAAPELLEALIKARIAISYYSPDPTEPLTEIDEAIVKAVGA